MLLSCAELRYLFLVFNFISIKTCDLWTMDCWSLLYTVLICVYQRWPGIPHWQKWWPILHGAFTSAN